MTDHADKDIGKGEPPSIAVRSANLCSDYGKQYGDVPGCWE